MERIHNSNRAFFFYLYRTHRRWFFFYFGIRRTIIVNFMNLNCIIMCGVIENICYTAYAVVNITSFHYLVTAECSFRQLIN